MINLEYYKPKIDTSQIPDEALELWFGKIGATFLRLIENTRITIDSRHSYIDYLGDKNLSLMSYHPEDKDLFLSDDDIIFVLRKKYPDFTLGKDILPIVKRVYSFEIDWII